MPANVVLASNTSSISITRIAAQTERPHKVVSTLMLCFLLAQGGCECLAMACCAEGGALLSTKSGCGAFVVAARYAAQLAPRTGRLRHSHR